MQRGSLALTLSNGGILAASPCGRIRSGFPMTASKSLFLYHPLGVKALLSTRPELESRSNLGQTHVSIFSSARD